jgi:DnaD/phage-associated family protein
MNEFRGFPDGKVEYTPLPNLFFSELLPLVDDLVELKVTLHVLFLLHNRKGSDTYVTLAELQKDVTLLRGLQGLPVAPEQALLDGLERAVRRGTLLHLATPHGQAQNLYCANNGRGRGTAEKIQLGEIRPLEDMELVEPPRLGERLNIYTLYEQAIGLLQPIIAEELKDAEASYPAAWIEEAFHIAASRNVRNWKYVRRILERWATEGKDEDKSRDRTWYTEEESRKYIKR